MTRTVGNSPIVMKDYDETTVTVLPPASGRESLGVHPAHVPHTDESDYKILHLVRDGQRW